VTSENVQEETKIIARSCCRVVLSFDCTNKWELCWAKAHAAVFIEITRSVLLPDSSYDFVLLVYQSVLC